ncbi:hypothetical protein [Proteus terrae]|uniref:hypothetical protein n=1 Tax=Proteus terrae TaxID=1574161 RepID=UPI0032DA9E6B
MDNNLKKSINKAYHSTYSKDSFLGLTIMLLFSKEFLPTNKHVADFVKKFFNVEFLSYAIRSRTLMSAKLSRIIIDMTDDELKKCHAFLLLTLRSNIEILEEVDIKKYKNKKKHAINNLNKWFSMKKESDE